MKDDEKAAALRKEARARHLLLKSSNDADSRFTFALKAGSIVIPRDARFVKKLLDLAAEICGERQGEHAELLDLRAARADLEPSSMPRDVVWTAKAKSEGGTRLEAWIDDQFLLEKAVRLIGFPDKT